MQPPAGSNPGMDTLEMLARVDTATDKVAARLDAATGKIETRMDTLVERVTIIGTKVDLIPGDIAQLRLAVDEHRKEIGALKLWRSFLAGAGAVVTLALTSGMVALLIEHGHRH